MIKCYIASPYSNGDKQENVNLQLDAAEILLKAGYAPYTPLLTHFQEIRHPRSETDWLALGLEFLSCCNVLIKIEPIVNGKELPSPGADAEKAYAEKLNIPVYTFNTIEKLSEFLEYYSFIENKI